MNALEKEILEALQSNTEGPSEEGKAKSAAEVAIKWIEKALREASAETFSNSKGVMTKVQDIYVKTWFEENVLTPTEPETTKI